jgi:hypothetical protein
VREREGLIRRIRQLRRATDASPPAANAEDPIALRTLEQRIGHLEQLLEALQDSVYREAERQSKRLSELEARTQPSALSVALSKDARERGL